MGLYKWEKLIFTIVAVSYSIERIEVCVMPKVVLQKQ